MVCVQAIRKQSFIETILQSLLFPEAMIQVYHYQLIFQKVKFTIAAMDNFDHSDFNSLTGTVGTQDTAMTLFQIKPESCCVKPLKSEINLKDIGSISLPCQQRENFSSNKCITISDTFKVKSELISEQEETIYSKLDDFSLDVLKKSKLVPNKSLPTWGALNSLISNSKLPIMQTDFLPFIPYPVPEHTTA